MCRGSGSFPDLTRGAFLFLPIFYGSENDIFFPTKIFLDFFFFLFEPVPLPNDFLRRCKSPPDFRTGIFRSNGFC